MWQLERQYFFFFSSSSPFSLSYFYLLSDCFFLLLSFFSFRVLFGTCVCWFIRVGVFAVVVLGLTFPTFGPCVFSPVSTSSLLLVFVCPPPLPSRVAFDVLFSLSKEMRVRVWFSQLPSRTLEAGPQVTFSFPAVFARGLHVCPGIATVSSGCASSLSLLSLPSTSNHTN